MITAVQITEPRESTYMHSVFEKPDVLTDKVILHMKHCLFKARCHHLTTPVSAAVKLKTPQRVCHLNHCSKTLTASESHVEIKESVCKFKI